MNTRLFFRGKTGFLGERRVVFNIENFGEYDDPQEHQVQETNNPETAFDFNNDTVEKNELSSDKEYWNSMFDKMAAPHRTPEENRVAMERALERGDLTPDQLLTGIQQGEEKLQTAETQQKKAGDEENKMSSRLVQEIGLQGTPNSSASVDNERPNELSSTALEPEIQRAEQASHYSGEQDETVVNSGEPKAGEKATAGGGAPKKQEMVGGASLGGGFDNTGESHPKKDLHSETNTRQTNLDTDGDGEIEGWEVLQASKEGVLPGAEYTVGQAVGNKDDENSEISHFTENVKNRGYDTEDLQFYADNRNVTDQVPKENSPDTHA